MRVRLIASMLVMASIGLAAPPASADDSRMKALIQELNEVTRAVEQGEQMLDAISEPMMLELGKAFVQVNPGFDVRIYEIVTQEFLAAARKDMSGFIQAQGMIWARHFSEDEIAGLIVFFRTPLGIKLLDKQSVMTQEGFALGARWAQDLAMRVMPKVIERLRAEGLKTDI
jgi:hypothetical protein